MVSEGCGADIPSSPDAERPSRLGLCSPFLPPQPCLLLYFCPAFFFHDLRRCSFRDSPLPLSGQKSNSFDASPLLSVLANRSPGLYPDVPPPIGALFFRHLNAEIIPLFFSLNYYA